MIITAFFLPFALPTLNELEAARGKIAAARDTGDRTRWNAYNELKRRTQSDIVVHVLRQKIPKVPPNQRVRLNFLWCAADRRHDPDNIAAGGRKLILDAITQLRPAVVSAGILHCDGWHCIAGFRDLFATALTGQVGVRVEIEAAQ